MQEMQREEFLQVFHLMEESFPPEEYRPRKEQEALLRDPAYHICVRRAEETGKICAFIAAWDFGTWVYIEHFAVSPDCRGAGLGGKMLREALASFGRRVVLEVEPPTDEMTCRRVGFYRRNGFSLNRYAYRQPSISAGRRPVPLLLMTTGGEITREEFDRVRALLYRRVYRVPAAESES